jgi:hypothetical protein
VKDGEDISIVVVLPSNIQDPAGAYPAIGQSYRVVANSFGPTFELVPLAPAPTLLKELPSPERR